MKRGDKLKFGGERRRYIIQAADDRFTIATKPAFGTYVYTIVDLQRDVRGACNLIFGPPADLSMEDGAIEALEMLQSGEMEVSYRNVVPLTPAERDQFTHTPVKGVAPPTPQPKP